MPIVYWLIGCFLLRGCDVESHQIRVCLLLKRVSELQKNNRNHPENICSIIHAKSIIQGAMDVQCCLLEQPQNLSSKQLEQSLVLMRV